MPVQRLWAAPYLLGGFPIRSFLPHQGTSQLLKNFCPQMQGDGRMRVGRDERRKRIRVARGDQLVQQGARSPELRGEGQVFALESVLRVGEERAARDDPGPAGRLIQG